jgi:hypothetical protein
LAFTRHQPGAGNAALLPAIADIERSPSHDLPVHRLLQKSCGSDSSLDGKTQNQAYFDLPRPEAVAA